MNSAGSLIYSNQGVRVFENSQSQYKNQWGQTRLKQNKSGR